MLTGIELAGLVLAVFPLVINGLEHYEEGFQCIKEWIRFRVEYSRFLNAVCRQKIFFRQNIEALLSPIVESEYEMSQLLDNPGSRVWNNAKLDDKLKKRLPGVMEYECYMATVSSIFEVLEKLKRKLKIVDGQAHWTETHSSAKKIRWELELKRLNYTLGHKRREHLMNELEKHNKDIQNMLGNSEKLEPMRRQRKSTIPKFFQKIRDQAHNLHSALGSAWKCDCKSSHATKLILEKRVRKDKIGLINIQDSTSVKFGVFFSSEIGSNLEWHGTEIMLAEPTADLERKLSRGIELERRTSLSTDAGSKFDNDTTSQVVSTISSLSIASSKHSKLFDSGSRSISFLGSSVESFPSCAPSNRVEIFDLCTTLKQRSKSPQFLGLLKDGTDRYFSVDVTAEPKILSKDTVCVITLESLLPTCSTGGGSSETDIALPRRVRLGIAVTLANSLLQLHSGPWLPETWSTKDIYFFQNSDGAIHADHPLVHNQYQSWTNQDESKDIINPITARRQRSHSGNPALLSLGIVILELWFNRTLASLSFRKDFLGPDGKENEFTNFNTAQKWQEMTMEEAGPDLYNPTRRCVYCAFGTASQDLEDDELRRAVYDEVVQPLERLLGRFEQVLVD